MLLIVGSLCLISLTLQVRETTGHSFMLSPKGDYKSYNKPECRIGGPPHAPDDNCPGPCIRKTSFQYDKNEEPTQYKRGQVVSMVWARNNHQGGFVRFSLVPKRDRMRKKVHDRMTFRYACFDSDIHKCKAAECGTDKESRAQRTNVEIPTCYPDGEYILGWAWYGGTLGTKSIYGDYYGCSSVVIRGGPTTSSYKPKFVPGENLDGSTTCPAATNRLGQCPREPCDGHVRKDRLPYQFDENRAPPRILKSWLTGTGEPLSTSATPEPIALGPQVSNEKKRLRVTELILLNADTGKTISSARGTVRLSSKDEPITFVALTEGPVAEVHFYLNDRWIRKESVAPYAFWGDTNEGYKYFAWPNPILGSRISIKAEARDSNGNTHKKVFRITLLAPN